MSSVSVSTANPSSKPKNALGTEGRIGGLDSIRFTCALIVVFGHIGFLPVRPSGHSLAGVEKILVGIYNCLFNGPAAVIIFFLISGFCIHFPYRDGRKVKMGVFYLRRFVRIGIPVLVAAILQRALLHTLEPLMDVGWSIACEMMYYLLYPALLIFGRRFGWPKAIALSGFAAAALMATHFHALSDGANGYRALGLNTWVVGLPVWLMGCWLAENYRAVSIPSVRSIWAIRTGVYVLSVLCELWRFHGPAAVASNCIALDLFAIPACYWLSKEIAFASVRPAPRLLEWAGTWSYSLYLIHMTTYFILPELGLGALSAGKTTHVLVLIAALLFSYLFFLLAERPSHQLSNAIGKYFRRSETRRPVAAVAAD